MKATLSEPLKSLVFLLMHAIVFYYIVFDGEELNFVWIFKVRNIDLVFFRPLMKVVLVDQQQVRLGANPSFKCTNESYFQCYFREGFKNL